MNEIIEKQNINVEDMIYEIDGNDIIVDTFEKFSERFSWNLSTKETTEISRSKF